MTAALVLCSLVTTAGLSGGSATVYRFVDERGQTHFVNHREDVPEGVRSDPVDLSEISLNPETEQALEAGAKKARDQAIAKAAAAPAAAQVSQLPSESGPPVEAQIWLSWAIAFSVTLLGLAILRQLTKRSAPGLSSAFGVFGYAAASLALMTWAGTAYEYRNSRHWLAEHFPPLHALEQAEKVKEQANQRQKALDQQLDEATKAKN